MIGAPKELNVSRETLQKLLIYENLLRDYSSRLNLVSRETLKDIWSRHFWDSLQLQLYIPSKKSSIMDLGTGAGFPGLVLAMDGYDQMTLVEKSKKKCMFLEKVKKELKLTVSILNHSIETVTPLSFKYIVSRACASLDKLLTYILPFTDDTTKCIFLKGETWFQDVQKAKQVFDFHMEAKPSLTHPKAHVLIISEIKKKNENYSHC